MASCCCSLAGTAACRTCSNNPNAETPPPVRTYTTIATDRVLIVGQKTNADRIRSMTDEELAVLLSNTDGDYPPNIPKGGIPINLCEQYWLDWLKQETSNE